MNTDFMDQQQNPCSSVISASFKMFTICVSVNRDFFMENSCSYFPRSFHFWLVLFYGLFTYPRPIIFFLRGKIRKLWNNFLTGDHPGHDFTDDGGQHDGAFQRRGDVKIFYPQPVPEADAPRLPIYKPLRSKVFIVRLRIQLPKAALNSAFALSWVLDIKAGSSTQVKMPFSNRSRPSIKTALIFRSLPEYTRLVIGS